MSDRATAIDPIATLPAVVALAKTYDLTPKDFVLTMRKMAMPAGHSDPEFVSCCLVAREHGLNPLTKEIYFMKTRDGSIQPIVGVDGWIRKCQEHPSFDGWDLSFEFEKTMAELAKERAQKALDDGNVPLFEKLIEVAAKLPEKPAAEKRKPISCTITIYRKDRKHPFVITEYFDECECPPGPKGPGPWQTNPKRMMRNRTICQGGRNAFGFAGIMERDEFEHWQSMKDVTPRKAMAAANDLPDIPDVPDIPDAVDEPPEPPAEKTADPAAFLDQLDTVLSACKDIDSLNESWDMNEATFDGLDMDQKEQAYAIFNKHEKRLEAAA